MRDAEQARDFFRRHPEAAAGLGARDGFSGATTGTGAADWLDPEPLGSDLPPVEPFSSGLLPASFRKHVEDVSERMQTPVDFAAAATMGALAGSVNRRATIQPKERDSGWVVVPNLWGANVGAPGLLKSPLLNAVTASLHAIDELLRQEHQSALDESKLEDEKAQRQLASWRELYKRASKKGNPPPIRPDTTLKAPARKRLIVADATFEKLHEILAENLAGALVIRDELTGWLAELGSFLADGDCFRDNLIDMSGTYFREATHYRPAVIVITRLVPGSIDNVALELAWGIGMEFWSSQCPALRMRGRTTLQSHTAGIWSP